MAKTADTKFRLRAVDKMSRTLDKVRGRFAPLNRSVDKLAKKFRNVRLRSAGFTQSMKNAGKKMRAFGASASRNVSAPIGLAFGAAIRSGLAYQKSINEVGAITQTIIGGKVSENFKKLDAQAKKFGSSTAFSATEVAGAMTELGRKGFNTNEILAATGPILDLAIATNYGLAESADIVSNSLRAFGLDAGETARVSDLFAIATAKSGIDMESLGETFKAVAPIAKAYGTSIDETVAITGLLGNVGIKGSMAGTALKNMFLKIAAPGSKATKMLKAMGLEVSNTDGTMRGIGDIITELGPKLGKLPKAGQMQVLNELFGLRGIAGGASLMAQAMKDGKDPVAAFTAVISDSAGKTKDMVETMRRGGVGDIQDFQSALDGAAITLAQSGLIEHLTALTGKLVDGFNWFQALGSGTRSMIVGTLGVVAVIGPLLMVLAPLVTIMGVLGPLLMAGAAAMVPFAAAAFMAALPFIIIAAKIALVVGAVLVAIKVLKMLGLFLADLFTNPTKALGNFVNRFKDGFGSIKGFFGLGGAQEEERRLALANRLSLNPAQDGPQALPSDGFLPNQLNQEFATRTNNARVDVNIRAPEQSNVTAKSDGAFMDLKTGIMGAL